MIALSAVVCAFGLVNGDVAVIIGAMVAPLLGPRTSISLPTTLANVGLALAAGAAGTLAFTGGGAEAVIGVTVAEAVVPPLVTAGLLVGACEVANSLAIPADTLS